jgi:hypothetical protein
MARTRRTDAIFFIINVSFSFSALRGLCGYHTQAKLQLNADIVNCGVRRGESSGIGLFIVEENALRLRFRAFFRTFKKKRPHPSFGKIASNFTEIHLPLKGKAMLPRVRPKAFPSAERSEAEGPAHRLCGPETRDRAQRQARGDSGEGGICEANDG